MILVSVKPSVPYKGFIVYRVGGYSWAGAATDCLSMVRFDGLDRPAGLDAGPNYSVAYTYDQLGRFVSVSAPNNREQITNIFVYAYLDGSDLLTGYRETNTGFSVTRSYEPNRNLIASITNSFGGTQLHRFDYTNDQLGRRTVRTDFNLSSSISNYFAYNIRSELEDAAMGTNSFNYSYDLIGNRQKAVQTIDNRLQTIDYVANSLNQYSAISNQQSKITPSYDLDGNMTSYKDWTFTWDAENRLVLASNATTVVSNSYDYMSRRVSKTVTDLSTLETRRSALTYQGWAMISGAEKGQVNRGLWRAR